MYNFLADNLGKPLTLELATKISEIYLNEVYAAKIKAFTQGLYRQPNVEPNETHDTAN